MLIANQRALTLSIGNALLFPNGTKNWAEDGPIWRIAGEAAIVIIFFERMFFFFRAEDTYGTLSLFVRTYNQLDILLELNIHSVALNLTHVQATICIK